MVTTLTLAGMDERRVLDMDLISLFALCDSVERVTNRQKTEEAWTRMYAAQARGEDMKKWVKRWENEGAQDVVAAEDTAKFIGLADSLNNRGK